MQIEIHGFVLLPAAVGQPASGEQAGTGEHQATTAGSGDGVVIGRGPMDVSTLDAGSATITAQTQQAAGGQRGTADGGDKTDVVLQRHGAVGEQLAVLGAACLLGQADADAFVHAPQRAGFHQIRTVWRFTLQVFLPAALRQPPTASRLATLVLRQHGQQRQRAGGHDTLGRYGGRKPLRMRLALIVFISSDEQVGRWCDEDFQLAALAACHMEGVEHETARLRRRTQGVMRHLILAEGGQIDTIVGQHARANRAGGHRGPGRHDAVAVAAGVTKGLIAAQKQHVQRRDETGGDVVHADSPVSERTSRARNSATLMKLRSQLMRLSSGCARTSRVRRCASFPACVLMEPWAWRAN